MHLDFHSSWSRISLLNKQPSLAWAFSSSSSEWIWCMHPARSTLIRSFNTPLMGWSEDGAECSCASVVSKWPHYAREEGQHSWEGWHKPENGWPSECNIVVSQQISSLDIYWGGTPVFKSRFKAGDSHRKTKKLSTIYNIQDQLVWPHILISKVQPCLTSSAF